jgi:protein-tyrosine phosphatase
MPGGETEVLEETVAPAIGRIAAEGVKMLVSLQDVPDSFGRECNARGIEWVSFPIRDFEVPDNDGEFASVIERVIASMKKDRPVCVHCRAGIGRTGMVLACILGRWLGIPGPKAISAVRKSRTALETREQEEYVRRFCAMQ